MFFIGSLITSALGGILLFVTDFGGFDASNYYLGVYIYGGIGAFTGIFGIPIVLSALGLFYCTGISILILKYPEKIPDKKYVQYGFYIAVIVFVVSIIGGIIFAIELELEDVWWWFDAGFYGGTIGGFLTAILFYFGLKDLEIT